MKRTFLHVKLVCCFLVTLVFLFTKSIAQNTVIGDTIDIAKMKTVYRIRENTHWQQTDKKNDPPSLLSSYAFKDTIPGKLLPSHVDKLIFLKFILTNSDDTTINVFFHPGYYFNEITLLSYDSAQRRIVEIADTGNQASQLGYREISVKGKETKPVYVKLKLLKTSNSLFPRLSTKNYIQSLVNNLKYGERDIHIYTFIFCGVLLMMIFYSMAVFAMNRSRLEFLYYSGYASIMVFMFFVKSYLYRTPSPFNYFFESYLDFVIHSFGIYVYIAFLRKFIDAKNNFPFLNRLFTIDQVLIIFSLVLYTYFYYGLDNFVAQYWLENFTKLVWTAFTIAFIAYALFAKKKLLYFLAIGHSCLFVFGMISMYFIFTGKNFPDLPPIFSTSMFYYETGLAIELIFFLIALAFKNRRDLIERIQERERLKLKTERQELEKQMAILSATQEERNRISADMHDELGSGVTAIRLMSEIVKTKMKDQTLPEIERISNSANDLINKMNTIIWTMKSENDSLESLIAYIRSYSCEFLESTNIDCTVLIPDVIPNLMLTGEKRRNIFLCVKESLNNVVKHAKARKVVIHFEFDDRLIIVISDDGQGIDKHKLREFGNGLTNMKKRMQGIDGEFHIENKNGTTSVLTVPV